MQRPNEDIVAEPTAVSLSETLASQLNALPVNPAGIVVALSGGPDSWALALLARDYCAANNIKFATLTVDHRLRPESTGEAQDVATECGRRGIAHETLAWQHDDIEARKQERARDARYQLMSAWCVSHGYSHLLTAHHADDQAETVLMRLAKGSGAAGLSGIAACRALNDNITLMRPFLCIAKDALIAHATEAGVPFVNDPSNNDVSYARVRLREAKTVLEREGLTTGNLVKLAETAREESEALAYAAEALLLKGLSENEGITTVPAANWITAPVALRRAGFLSIWRRFRGTEEAYQPRREEIDALTEALAGGYSKRTLGGLICARGNSTMTFTREA